MLQNKLRRALDFRQDLIRELDPLSERHAALRLFNGFTEGQAGFAVDLYGSSLVIFDYAQDSGHNQELIQAAVEFYQAALPFISCVLLKARAAGPATRLLIGSTPDAWVMEHGVRYAINLLLHQDATLYLDTRRLRRWVIQNLAGKRLLNTFAYTGSLGAAAQKAGARRVLQTDLDRAFLDLAQQTYRLNNWPVSTRDFLVGDFFSSVASLKRQELLFDCVILDPPFFSETPRGRVNLNSAYTRLVNKVRPLVAHQGWLVAVNNALFVSGAKFMGLLEHLCADGYLSIEALLPAPPDFSGCPDLQTGTLPSDPAPFNHSTKIALLRVKRKDERV